ncbi:MAG TPA: hypothetical protein VN786_00375 [Acidimicrobiales bacterium]|nr:hypothetical protein [Acidimicrobiales bacterium]
MPDPGDGALGVPALSGGPVNIGRVILQQVQVLPRGDTSLCDVGSGLLDGQREESQLRAQLHRAIQITRSRWGENPSEQVQSLGRVKHVEVDRLGEVVPAGGASAGDQVPAGRSLRQQRRDLRRVAHVVQHHQPSSVGRQPLRSAVSQRLGGQDVGQGRLQASGQAG